MKPETLHSEGKDQLSLVLSFFARVDSKLSVLLAIDTGMLAMLGGNAPALSALTPLMIVVACIAVTLSGASIVFLYRGAFPSLKGGHGSLVYFREIANRTEHKFIEDFKEQTDEQRLNDILAQVWRNSEILRAKFDALRAAFTLLAVAIIPWGVSLLLFGIYNSHVRSVLFK